MKILSIETSCDETAVSIVKAEGGLDSPSFRVLGNALFSQIDLHREYGGVFPTLAKREHAKNLPILLKRALGDNNTLTDKNEYSEDVWRDIEQILSKEGDLYPVFKKEFENIEKPDIDVIGVTSGPGLEPALWVGISFALALGKLWQVPVVPANHMEGHIISVLVENTDQRKVNFPAIAVLISGGHTEIVGIEGWGKYKILGQTVDDAVGEAFDKTARMLGLPYPGGPEISKLAKYAEENNITRKAKLPRPMIKSDNINFSFSGLKTSVLYYIRDNFSGDAGSMSMDDKADLAREFQDSVIEVLMYKTKKALDETGAKTLIVAGGVIADKKIRESFTKLESEYRELEVKIPTSSLATDNSLMIAGAVYININLYPDILSFPQKIVAKGNLKLE